MIDVNVGDAQLAEHFNRCMDCPVEDLLDELPRTTLPEVRWSLPPDDLAALRAWGVPSMRQRNPQFPVQLVAHLQTEQQPQVAIRPERGYRLGAFWRLELAALEVRGNVVGLRPDSPRPFPINTTTRRFLELAWRWGVGSEYLAELSVRPDYEGGFVYTGLEIFQELVRRVDPEGAADTACRFWDDIVNGW